MGAINVANEFVQTMADARVDAKSLSGFMSEPSNVKAPRRLAPPINTLNYFLDYLRALELVYSQQTGVVNVNGVQVKAVAQAVRDALNSAAIDNNTQVDTLITSTPKHVGAIARNLSEKNDDFIDIRDFTSPTDTDHTSGLNAAATVALAQKKKLQGAGTYYIKSADVNFRSVQLDLGDCKFIITEPYKIIMGGDAGSALNPNQIIGDVINPSFSYTPETIVNPTLQIIGAKNQYIKMGFIQYLQFYQSTDPLTFPSNASQAYSTFDIAFAVKLSIDTDPRYASGGASDGAGSRIQWFNENTINIKKCTGFYMRGSYSHNNNIINGGSFEGASIIKIESGSNNHFNSMRFESLTLTVTFDSGTHGNIIKQSWFSSLATWWITPTVTDNGTFNSVKTVADAASNKRVLLNLSNNDTVYNNHIGSYNRGASALYIKSKLAAYSVIAQTEVFRLRKNDYLMLQLDMASAGYYQVQIQLYDNNKQLLTLSTASVITETPLTVNVGANAYQGNVSKITRFLHNDDRVFYASLRLLTSNSFADQKARTITAYISSLKPMDSQDYGSAVLSAESTLVTSKPTQFVGKLGDVIRKLDGTSYYCTHMIRTTLTASSSTAEIGVADFYSPLTLSSLIGDLVGVELDNNSVHWSTISAISGKDITLTDALPSNASATNMVYISRLA